MINAIRQLARPLTPIMLMAMTLPAAFVLVIIELLFPGKGIQAGNVMVNYLSKLPEMFWATLLGTHVGYSVSRSFGHDKKSDAIKEYAEVAKRSLQKDAEDIEYGDGPDEDIR